MPKKTCWSDDLSAEDSTRLLQIDRCPISVKYSNPSQNLGKKGEHQQTSVFERIREIKHVKHGMNINCNYHIYKPLLVFA